MADSKDHGVATQTSGYNSESANNIDEKHRAGKSAESADVDLPTYDDTERHGSEAVNISGVHDKTHRKLKGRHIQLIGSVHDRAAKISHERPQTSGSLQYVASEAPSVPRSTSKSAAASFKAGLQASSSPSPYGAL